MNKRTTALFRIETLIVVLMLVAYSLTWISWGKLIVSGWGLPGLYSKMTKVSNTILFFTKKDSPHLAYFIYIVPTLGCLSLLLLLVLKRRFANFILLLASVLSLSVSLYMYYYFISSKIFKFPNNTGIGVHLLCFAGIAGILYTVFYGCRRKAKPKEEAVAVGEPPLT
jgi:hypothetical protein